MDRFVSKQKKERQAGWSQRREDRGGEKSSGFLVMGRPFYLCKRFAAFPISWCGAAALETPVIKTHWRSVKLNRVRGRPVISAMAASVGGPSHCCSKAISVSVELYGWDGSITNPSHNRINTSFLFSEWKGKTCTASLPYLEVVNSAHFQLCSVPCSHTGGWIYYLLRCSVTAQEKKLKGKKNRKETFIVEKSFSFIAATLTLLWHTWTHRFTRAVINVPNNIWVGLKMRIWHLNTPLSLQKSFFLHSWIDFSVVFNNRLLYTLTTRPWRPE